ncbi:hypothetical protein M0R89_17425 [Halorussus limi]|uniref:GIY-YIG domain-containing protein n=1 Tax=Halorussus limi TaxID=2938695 RepID=A0A8U0HUG7_9EURY|nr:hypothetical protein [Halorussus limi]UPV74304.1 hypothetical protein M0R89_17425 [Halorussus limi]
MTRRTDLDRFYGLLHELRERVGGYRYLANSTGRMDWPDRGVYFFFAREVSRTDDDQPRVARVGTHAVSEGSGTTLWDRLRGHRGTFSGGHEDGGNHRGSVFRLRVGEALIDREGLADEYPYWGEGSSAPKDGLRDEEYDMEKRVSFYVRGMPLLWVDVDDEPGPDSDRAYIERNAIALLSNYRRESLDPRDTRWLGTSSSSPEIRQSGLWNVDHVEEDYDPAFLDVFEEYVAETGY